MRKPKQQIPEYIASKVFARDGKKCRYCGSTTGPFHLDHVYPESKGGELTVDNLVVACKKCNLHKRSKIGVWPKPLGYFDDIAEKNSTILDQSNRLRRDAPIVFLLAGLVGVLLVSVGPLFDIAMPYYLRVLGMLALATGVVGEMAWSAKR